MGEKLTEEELAPLPTWARYVKADYLRVHGEKASFVVEVEIGMTVRSLARALLENKRLRAALEIYADADNWIDNEILTTTSIDGKSIIISDNGEMARRALAEIKEEVEDEQ